MDFICECRMKLVLALVFLTFCAASSADSKAAKKPSFVKEDGDLGDFRSDDFGDFEDEDFEDRIGDEEVDEDWPFEISTDDTNERAAPAMAIEVRNPGLIRSPLTSKNKYPKRLNRIWRMRAPVGKKVRMEFTIFRVQRHKTCEKDFVTMNDGPTLKDPLIAKLCGVDQSDLFYPNGTYLSTGRFLTLRFKTDSRVQLRGWVARVMFVDAKIPCTSTPTVLTAGTTLSHPYSGLYQADQECRWLMQAPNGQYVEFTLTGMDMEYDDNCLYDYLETHDGDNPNAVAIGNRLCGSIDDVMESELVKRSSGRSMFLVFSSDLTMHGEGFQGQFSIVNSPGVPLCPASVLELSGKGTIVFPPLGDRYVNQMSCEWLFSASQGQKIKLTFWHFDVEYEAACQFDALNVYDSDSPTAWPSHTLCGEIALGYEITSARNYLFMHFSSDDIYTATGFEIDYETVGGDDEDDEEDGSDRDKDLPIFGCSQEIQVIPPEGGIIQVPLNGSTYDNNLNCTWTLYAPDDHVVRVKFLSVDIVPSESCVEDRVDLAEGEQLAGNFIGQVCGTSIPEQEFISEANVMTIRFFTNAADVASGFKLIIRSGMNGMCGSPLITRSGGRIVGGQIAKPHSWPWQVSLREHRDNGHFCGGSIISPNWIVTAAQCINAGMEDFVFVLAGAHLKQWSGSGETTRQVKSIAEIIQYPGFSVIGTAPDVALIRLTTPLDLDPGSTGGSAHQVCLPPGDAQVPDYTSCFTTGWGDTRNPDLQNYLNEVEVPIVPQDVCNSLNYYDGDILDFEVCAGYEEGGKDSCYEDAGGPLVCLINGKYELHGITSWGIGCAERMTPGVYTRVVEVVDWINSIIESE